MNREQAKSVLRSYHPGEPTAGNESLRQALELLEHDTELAAWFAEEQAVDARLSKSFRQFPVPPDLKEQLLAARKIVSPRVWWRRTEWLAAAAACLLLLGTLAAFVARSPRPLPFSDFRSYVIDTASSFDHLDLETSDYAQIRAWLQGRGAPKDFTIPATLNGKSTEGCRVFQWNEQKVSLVCFQVGGGKVAHLFVVDRSTLRNLPAGQTPQIRAAPNGIATASWSDARQVYILALQNGERELRDLVL